MQLSPDLLADTVQDLERHEESLRIKKLIFCLCKKYWENDLNILNSFSLDDLILEMVQAKPTIEQLTYSVYKLVKTLNRPKVYANVAKAILDRMSFVYSDLADRSAVLPSPVMANLSEIVDVEIGDVDIGDVELHEVELEEMAASDRDPERELDRIASDLTGHPEESRIKKLIFSVCKNRWENNLQVIDNYGLKDLILETCQVYPTKGDLQIALAKIVENINKQTLYLAVSNIIVNQLSPLYETLAESLDQDSDLRGSDRSFDTQIVPLRSAPLPQTALPDRHKDCETSIIDLSEQMVTELKSRNDITPVPPPKTYDIFELRQIIMQYTNPLRAKILLFSVLFHPWDRSGQDWSMLRS